MGDTTGKRPRALITGASAGIGRAFAERLARDGYDVVVVARRRERLDALARQLERDHGVAAQVLAADLTQPDDLRRVEQYVAQDQALDLLVNNAGFPGYMPFVELDPDRAEELIRLHIVATTRLTRAALPGLVARDRGAIINVASMLAFSASIPGMSPLPKRAIYAACKAYIVSFSELLHHELEGTHVRVQALCPGPGRRHRVS
jgi:short-subunit dehydrogenase